MDIAKKLEMLEQSKKTLDSLTIELRKRGYALAVAERDYRKALAIKELELKNTVIATGGSVVYGKEAMEKLKNTGVIVYINLSCEEIKNRVRNIKTRGIVMKKGKTMDDIYEERVPLYEKYADIVVDGEKTSIETCVERIILALNGNAPY